jgi:hypothetical protein
VPGSIVSAGSSLRASRATASSRPPRSTMNLMESGKTFGAPIRKGERIACTIDWDGQEARLITLPTR